MKKKADKEDNKQLYLSEIRQTLGGFGWTNKPGEILTLTTDKYVDVDGTITQTIDGTKQVRKLDELTEEELYELYVFLDANKFTKQIEIKRVLIEPADGKMWRIEPQEIKGDDDAIIGYMGVAVEEVHEHTTILSALFISTDGTWSTLTCWSEGNEDELETAKVDLNKIGDRLKELSETIK